MNRNHVVGGAVVAAVVVMAGLSFAAVPLYDLFCRVTGFAGTPGIAASAPGGAGHAITVRFNADVAPGLPWRFEPVERQLTVETGASVLAFYRATNDGAEPVTGTATFNVTPLQAGQYVQKIDCFCFEEQRLDPGQTVDMPLTFYVDPAIAADRATREVTAVTLSYTFFGADEANPDATIAFAAPVPAAAASSPEESLRGSHP
ncbi:MAG: cytochrome c oxidase assembly protein [Rhodospirillales bacterium]|nr:cytochrome c oxidase assembly protein [Rhodospirillales bacterium]MCY3855556.1 cytochrome c oxidase assembly protein [Rhodospirillales bacterium]MCY4002306.1 cytochrome c oxidase assembly protein [Rhodospirillales bacterium]MCY4096793.1 cytochrome c oxidase assembly protein [Rhodospirillales bacterium]